MLLSGHDVEVGKGAQGGKRFAAETEGVKGGQVIVGGQFGSIVLQS